MSADSRSRALRLALDMTIVALASVVIVTKPAGAASPAICYNDERCSDPTFGYCEFAQEYWCQPFWPTGCRTCV